MSESELGKPEPDVEEQQHPITTEPEDEPPSVPFEVNEADAVEQHREVSLDEDDYR